MAITTKENIADLRAFLGTTEGDVVYVNGYFYNNDGGGGHFIWRENLNYPDNNGTVIVPTANISNPADGFWMRSIEGTSINVRWFGLLGDYAAQHNDDSGRLMSLINTFKDNDGFDLQMPGIKGVRVVFPKGGYVLGNIDVFTGFTFVGEQSARNNVFVASPVIIMPKDDVEYIFNFATDSMNAGLENLNIHGQNESTGKKLIAAVLFRGTFNFLKNNNIVECRQHAVLGAGMGCRIERNNLHGMKDSPEEEDKIVWPSLFGTEHGYLGSVHLSSFGDSYIIDNEIGSGSDYSELKNPDARSVAFFGREISGSVTSGNIFENADKAVYLMDTVYSNFIGNRYEYSIAGGLEIWNVAQCVFNGERFMHNSLGEEGEYDDLTINENCSNSAFMSLLFSKFYNPAVPTSARKTRYAITNYRDNDVWLNKFVIPYFAPLGFVGAPVNVSGGAIAPYTIS